MQAYMKYGLGFPASLLTEEEFAKVYLACQYGEDFGLSLVGFTEGELGRDWATVVIQSFGELPNTGKLATFAQIKSLCAKQAIIDIPTKEKISQELRRFHLEHLLDKVEVIVYLSHY